MTDSNLKQTTLETFQKFLNKYEIVCKKAFTFNKTELFPAEIHTLDFILRKGVSFVSEIAKETGTTRGAASQMTVRLKKKGLLKAESDPKNKSRILLKPTAKGKKACLDHEIHHMEKDKDFHAFFDSLDNKKMEEIKEMFKMMDLWMDKYL